jgi:hypothetical protein
MVNHHPDKRLEIKKNGDWELWLVSPTSQARLGSFPTLEELNRAEITLYQVWESGRYPLEAAVCWKGTTGPL